MGNGILSLRLIIGLRNSFVMTRTSMLITDVINVATLVLVIFLNTSMYVCKGKEIKTYVQIPTKLLFLLLNHIWPIT